MSRSRRRQRPEEAVSLGLATSPAPIRLRRNRHWCLGGCYIENMFTLHIGAHLTMTLWLGEQQIEIDAMVKTCDPVFGNGIEFLEVPPLERFKLRAYLDSVAAT